MNTKDLYSKFSGVMELKAKDFNISKNKITIINKKFLNNYGLIAFYAPWCPHCKQMVELWSDLAIQFQHKFIIAAVNCENTNNQIICSKLRIDHYPTIKYVIKNGTLYDYDGRDTKDDMIFFICSKL